MIKKNKEKRMKKSEMKRRLKAAMYLMDARARHIEQLKGEIKVYEALKQVSEAYITYLAAGHGEIIKIPKKELSRIIGTSTIIASEDEKHYILKVVKKADLEKAIEDEKADENNDSKTR